MGTNKEYANKIVLSETFTPLVCLLSKYEIKGELKGVKCGVLVQTKLCLVARTRHSYVF
jgi:hypothetical protein